MPSSAQLNLAANWLGLLIQYQASCCLSWSLVELQLKNILTGDRFIKSETRLGSTSWTLAELGNSYPLAGSQLPPKMWLQPEALLLIFQLQSGWGDRQVAAGGRGRLNMASRTWAWPDLDNFTYNFRTLNAKGKLTFLKSTRIY